ncbi:50S ribosomal protein L23 [Ferrovum myxofaciens]|jgi:large subunit ribosomal protein L23|uniref:Large ribosomal subunit protein uL23 n=2 Tax=root TaxID=1 RepID=A0A149W0U5_9PROT|nr:50S ribosomal protein L23 [Ferrovum myxofaciens]QKE41432.1 MAG: 50S ribosomal protein L23 [Ferrovum myxofaciens]
MNTIFREERLLQIIEAPVISEKSTRVADKHQQAVFRVICDATKAEIKAAVQHLFKVEVDTVQVVNVKGKHKRSGRFVGKRKDWKKAYVCLKAGQELNLVQGE